MASSSSSSASTLKKSLLSLLSRIPEENVFRPGYNFPGALRPILNERFDSLAASSSTPDKLPEYDEQVLKSMEKGLKDITEDRWSKQYPMAPHILLPASNPMQYYRLVDAEHIVGTTRQAKPFWRTFFELEAAGFEERVNSGVLDQKLGLPKRKEGTTTEVFREMVLKGELRK
ncbi:hypothetical protein BDY24DRAFT_411099 [Mrakia frigida]|uniref:uncharacterized protein n=1 Tax=Mrakia frigida TaxID=29902 RepID=UPI003FCBF350